MNSGGKSQILLQRLREIGLDLENDLILLDLIFDNFLASR